MKCFWNICYDIQYMDIQAFIMDNLIVCMSFKYQMLTVCKQRRIFKLERNTFYKNVVPGLYERQLIFHKREEVLE